MTLSLLLAGQLATPPLVAAPRTFHVDASHGDDAGDGLSAATAWQSLARVNRAELRPGDTVRFRRGETWRGQLLPQSGDATGPVTYATYGDGAKPVLLGSAARDRVEDWVDLGGGIWATLPLRYEPIRQVADLRGARFTLYCEGGAAASFSQNAAGLHIECRQSGTAAHHIQLITSGQNVSEGADYLLALRARASQPVALSGLTIQRDGSPWTTYAGSPTGEQRVGPEWQDLPARFHATQTATGARLVLYLGGLLPAGGTLDLQFGALSLARSNQAEPLSVDVGNVIFDGGATPCGVKRWKPEDLRQPGDYWYDAANAQVRLRSDGNPATLHRHIELALRRHIIDQGGKGWLTYEGLDLRYGAAHGIGGGSTQHITVRDCDLSYIGGGHQFTPPGGKPVRFGNGIEFWASAHDCLIEGCRIWEVYDAALTNQGDGTNVQENITYRRNVIWHSEYSFEFWNRGPASRTRNIRFEQNVCVDAGYGWGHGQRPDPNGRHLMFYDNTAQTEAVSVTHNLFANAVDSLLRLTGPDWTGVLSLDDNLWYQRSGPLWLWRQEKVGADTFGAFTAAHSLARRAVLAEPKFVDAAQHDYRLAPDSPGRELLTGDRP